jgi:hypothetical protein
MVFFANRLPVAFQVLAMRWDWKTESGALKRVELSNSGDVDEDDDEEMDDHKAFEQWKSKQIDPVTLTATERLQYYQMVKHLEDEVIRG